MSSLVRIHTRGDGEKMVPWVPVARIKVRFMGSVLQSQGKSLLEAMMCTSPDNTQQIKQHANESSIAKDSVTVLKIQPLSCR